MSCTGSSVSETWGTEAAHDVDDQIDLADVRQELIPQSLPPAGAFYQTGDIDEFNCGVDRLRAPGLGLKRLQARVGDRDDGAVGLDRAEGVAGHLSDLRLGERVEGGALTHIGQAYDSDAEAHRMNLPFTLVT